MIPQQSIETASREFLTFGKRRMRGFLCNDRITNGVFRFDLENTSLTYAAAEDVSRCIDFMSCASIWRWMQDGKFNERRVACEDYFRNLLTYVRKIKSFGNVRDFPRNRAMNVRMMLKESERSYEGPVFYAAIDYQARSHREPMRGMRVYRVDITNYQ